MGTQIQGHAAQEGAFKTLSIYGQELEHLPAEMVEKEIEAVISRFIRNVDIRSIPGSYAIHVEYTSLDPNKAALIANTLVDVYIEQRLEDKFKAAKKLTAWLDKRLGDLRTQVRESEESVQYYKKEYGIVEGTRTLVSAEQLSNLNCAAGFSADQTSGGQCAVAACSEFVRAGENIEAVPEVVDSPLIRNLKLQDLETEQGLSQLQKRYGPKHPRIIKLHAERAS